MIGMAAFFAVIHLVIFENKYAEREKRNSK